MAERVRYGEGRNLLISATVDVVAEKGLRGLTFRAVAAHASVNNSLVAHHFGTRENLLAAALESTVEQSIEATQLYDLASEEAFSEAFLSSITAHPEWHVFQYAMIMESTRNPMFREPVARLYKRYQEVAALSLQQIGITENLDATARRTFAALDGMVMQYLAGVPLPKIRMALSDLWSSLHAAATVH